ncbi:hypothetical protein [Grimontia marina]|uniref:Uncharacterized protein n=1 Tax=Grimontia marina TaxID=646534 RepID=A0A128EZV1_9GAMM|nr:hypothetical protein [Grimontia marina]CZF79680.1 hypothetical protein GMA8713_01080 [Grimontia marina]
MIVKPHPIKTPIKEHNAIKEAIASWHKTYEDRFRVSSQFGRVLNVASGPAWKTLRQIEADIAFFFPETPDTQAAISARLREVSPSLCGLVKQRRQYTSDSGKQVHVYRLVPAAWLALTHGNHLEKAA